MTRVNQGLFSTTMEAEKRDPGNEVGRLHASEIQYKDNKRFFSFRSFATDLREFATLSPLKKNLCDQGIKTYNLVNSRCCFTEYAKEMHGNSWCTCRTGIFRDRVRT